MDAFERLALLQLLSPWCAAWLLPRPRLTALERRTVRGMVNRSYGGRP